MNNNYNLLRSKDIIAILDGDFQIEEVDGIRIAMPYLSGPKRELFKFYIKNLRTFKSVS